MLRHGIRETSNSIIPFSDKSLERQKQFLFEINNEETSIRRKKMSTAAKLGLGKKSDSKLKGRKNNN